VSKKKGDQTSQGGKKDLSDAVSIRMQEGRPKGKKKGKRIKKKDGARKSPGVHLMKKDLRGRPRKKSRERQRGEEGEKL